MINISDKTVGKIKTQKFTFNNFSPENCAAYETMWKIAVEPDRQ
jgi:hypothetical protein